MIKYKIGGYKARYINHILSTAYKLILPTEVHLLKFSRYHIIVIYNIRQSYNYVHVYLLIITYLNVLSKMIYITILAYMKWYGLLTPNAIKYGKNV